MKLPRLCLPLTALGLLAASCLPSLHAEDKPPIKVDRATADKAKAVLEKLVAEAKEAASKGERKGRELWQRTKETLALSREDYAKKVLSGLATMEAEIQVLEESGSAVTTRDYFKTRIESLKQHLDYCKRDFARLQEAPSEEAFRVKQRGFDRGLGFLGENIESAQEEAGL